MTRQERCIKLRKHIEDLSQNNAIDLYVFEAIDAYENEPYYLKRIAELENQLYLKIEAAKADHSLKGKQAKVFEAIQIFMNEKRYPPSVRELCEIVGVKSPSTMHGHLERLKKKGLLNWEPGNPRTLIITI